jgi:hypothetical protein
LSIKICCRSFQIAATPITLWAKGETDILIRNWEWGIGNGELGI